MALRSIHSIVRDQFQSAWVNSVAPVVTVREGKPVTLQTREASNHQIKPGDGAERIEGG